ncbi:MAG: hypothetical protein ACK4XJ_09635 [Fimbriimonadaceae bacterium]
MMSLPLFLMVNATEVEAPIPDARNFVEWRTYIRPKPAETSFEALDWKPTLWEGVMEGQRTGKPIVIWAMNGHPMACT